jgi:hypothetical protein
MFLGNTTVRLVNFVLSGADADLYETSEVFEFFGSVRILPEIDVSPVPSMYTDGESGDITVSLKSGGKLINGLPDGLRNYNGFTITIIPYMSGAFINNPDDGNRNDGVYIEPSVLEFSSASQSALRSFRIRHVQPTLFNTQTMYYLGYFIHAANTPGLGVLINNWLPAHAQTVTLRRYRIIPEFPKVLSYSWDFASFNLTRVCDSVVTITPRTPDVPGGFNKIYSGHLVPNGRVFFDPPVVSFAPGQMVATFMVKAARGIDVDHGYYRVDYELSGAPNDMQNFNEFIHGDTFSTWHMASATVAQLCLPLFTLLVSILSFL